MPHAYIFIIPASLLPYPGSIYQVVVYVRKIFYYFVEDIGMLCLIPGQKRVIEKLAPYLTRFGRVTCRRFHCLPQHHKRHSLLPGKFRYGRY